MTRTAPADHTIRINVTGDEAKLFPNHCYYVPVIDPVREELTYIPVIPGKPYPRWIVKPNITAETKVRCDFEVRFIADKSTGRYATQARVLKSPYGDEPDRLIGGGECDHQLDLEQVAEYMVSRAIRERRRQ